MSGVGSTSKVKDVKGFAATGFEQVAEALGAGATLTLGDRERRADLGDGRRCLLRVR